MNKNQMKIIGIVALIVCAVCIFIAIERYQTNANNVRAMNQMRNSAPFGDMMGPGPMRPATPAATKYALLLALISGLTGAVLLIKGLGGPPEQGSSQQGPLPEQDKPPK
jgi:TctA family transporter